MPGSGGIFYIRQVLNQIPWKRFLWNIGSSWPTRNKKQFPPFKKSLGIFCFGAFGKNEYWVVFWSQEGLSVSVKSSGPAVGLLVFQHWHTALLIVLYQFLHLLLPSFYLLFKIYLLLLLFETVSLYVALPGLETRLVFKVSPASASHSIKI